MLVFSLPAIYCNY